MRKYIWVALFLLNPIFANGADAWVNKVEIFLEQNKPDAFEQYKHLPPEQKAAFLQDILRYHSYEQPFSEPPVAELDLINAVLKKYDNLA